MKWNKCINPRIIPNPKYPGEGETLIVPCNKCIFCQKKYIADWTCRLIDESRNPGYHYFITLTYENAPDNYVLSDIQNYIKKIRNHVTKTNSIRYFIVGERGDLHGRVHYHGIIFSSSYTDIRTVIMDSWCHGFTKIGTVTPQSIGYVCKYIVPLAGNDKLLVMSRKPGLGSNRLRPSFVKSQQNNPRGYYIQNGFKKRLPRYYKDKLKQYDVELPRQSYKDQLAELDVYDREYGLYDEKQFWRKGKSYKQQLEENVRYTFEKSKKGKKES